MATAALFFAPARHNISAIASTSAFVLSFDDGMGGLNENQAISAFE